MALVVRKIGCVSKTLGDSDSEVRQVRLSEEIYSFASQADALMLKIDDSTKELECRSN
jgi:hypothetical protein